MMSTMLFNRKKPSPPHEWYNPKPESIGQVVAALLTQSGSHKSLVIRTKETRFCVYLYKRDESDIAARRSSAVGWIGEVGPSFTDTLERAKELAAEYLPAESNKPTGKGRSM